MRLPLLVLGALAIVVLGGLQTVAAVALRAGAVDASLPRLAPGVVTSAVASLEPHGALPQELRRVLAATALSRGDVARAERFANTLSPGADRLDLEARIEDARGAHDAATRDFVAAGDLTSIEARVDALVGKDELVAALELQSHAIDALRVARVQNDTFAEALYRDGLLQQARAYEFSADSRARTSLESAAADSYRRAAAYAPLDLRYAIALGNQYLNTAQYALARATFERVRDLDPANVDALTGLADDAIRERKYADARLFLDRARTLSPGSPAIARMSARIPHE